MSTDPATIQDRLLHALGSIQAAHGCLLGSTIANAGLISDYLAEASVAVRSSLNDAAVMSDQNKMLRYWLQWVMDNCDDSPEWNFGTDTTNKIKALLSDIHKGIIKELPNG